MVTMRITTDMSVRMLTAALQRQQQDQFVTQRQLASGRKVNVASDDPGAYEAIRNLTSDQSQLEQFERNINTAGTYLSVADQGIMQAVNLIHGANELVVRSSDGTMDPTLREAMAEEANQILGSMLAVANGSEGGRYTFAGLRTDTPPYVAEVDPESGRITAVTYQGSEETRVIKTGQELYMPTNIAGSSSTTEGGIFQTQTRDVFDSLIRLRDTLLADGNVADTDIMQQMSEDLTHVLNQASLNGARQEQVVTHLQFVREMQLTNLSSLESLESVDPAEAIMRLSQIKTAYQAALQSTSVMLEQTSLLKYI